MIFSRTLRVQLTAEVGDNERIENFFGCEIYVDKNIRIISFLLFISQLHFKKNYRISFFYKVFTM